MNFDNLGDRMKFYEGDFVNKRLMPLIPIIVRLDGVAFHTFTRGMNRPYDEVLSNTMMSVTKELVNETNALLGYTQSDEISLLLYSDDTRSQVYFDGKFQKIVSVLAAKTSVWFNSVFEYNRRQARKPAVPLDAFFDCRAFNVPTQWEACNHFIWREQDATRNSISMAAQSVYSHSELQGKSCNEMQEMLFQKGINWNDYPEFFKRGSFFLRRTEIDKWNIYEEEKTYKRYVSNVPILTTVENLPQFIFSQEPPRLKNHEVCKTN